ncbi:MAG TPA: type II toxin-antitoxin system HicA family toxin [Allosphingosinicella sp.]|nr:type II toxin-antitoxin system HicA family toxin [Allosphingosinicella sp.]
MGRRGEKLLERMRDNPADWRIDDVKALCNAFGLDFDRPPNGSHYGVSDPTQAAHVTVPFARPVKRVYIRQLVRFVDAVRAAREKGQ